MAEKRKILIIMMDGFDPAYLQASDMPNTKQMIANGFYKTVKSVMPTVTNVNNTGICCGCAPKDHGITANSYFDLATKKEEYMDKSEMVLAPTIFERGQKLGMKSSLMTAKRKTQSLLRTGSTIRLAAERPGEAEGSDFDWTDRLGPAPDIYSPRDQSLAVPGNSDCVERNGQRHHLFSYDGFSDAYGTAQRRHVAVPLA